MKARRIVTASLLAAAATGTLFSPGAMAAQPNAGGGALHGVVTFAGNGIPAVNTPCRAASFTFSAEATITLANGAGSQSAWLLRSPFGSNLTGSGSSTCENTAVGGGLVSINNIDVVNPVTQTRLRCTGMTGAYTRQLTDLAAALGGFCAIDGHDAGKVGIYVRAHVAPSPETGNGITTNVRTATITAEFTVVPA